MKNRPIPFPQANNVDKMISFLFMYANDFNKSEISKQMEIDPRQVNYYLNAWKYLGVLSQTEDSEKIISRILQSTYKDQKEIIRLIMESHYEIGVYIKAKVINEGKFFETFSSYSKVTIKRRLSTIRAWRKWLGQE